MEAFQCLNQALNIDNDNVEGLVARGALYANNGGLDKAVEDFEAVEAVLEIVEAEVVALEVKS